MSFCVSLISKFALLAVGKGRIYEYGSSLKKER